MKTKMTKDIVPEGFTMRLALVDALPVIFFAGSMILIGQRFSSKLFMLGALLCLIGGMGKVLWKVIVVLKKKNVWPLFVQMRLLMPLGFLLMICSLIANADRISFEEIIKACVRFPSIMCFVTGIAGMVLMTACALCLDSSDVRANWVEQLINGMAQGAFFLGIPCRREENITPLKAPAAVIHKAGATIAVSGDIPERLLSQIMKEVLHA